MEINEGVEMMQPMTRDVRECRILHRTVDNEKGYSEQVFKETASKIRVYFFPTADSMTRDPNGTVQDVRYKAVINQPIDISLGDRINTGAEEFEVTSLLSLVYPKNHQMELKRVWTST